MHSCSSPHGLVCQTLKLRSNGVVKRNVCKHVGIHTYNNSTQYIWYPPNKLARVPSRITFRVESHVARVGRPEAATDSYYIRLLRRCRFQITEMMGNSFQLSVLLHTSHAQRPYPASGVADGCLEPNLEPPHQTLAGASGVSHDHTTQAGISASFLPL